MSLLMGEIIEHTKTRIFYKVVTKIPSQGRHKQDLLFLLRSQQ